MIKIIGIVGIIVLLLALISCPSESDKEENPEPPPIIMMHPTAITEFTASRATITEAEGDSQSATITLTLNRQVPAGGEALPFNYMIGGEIDADDLSSHDDLNGIITVAAGESSGALTITAFDDMEDEGESERLTISLGDPPMNADGAQIMPPDITSRIITITDNDDPPEVAPTQITGFEAASPTITEASGDSQSTTVTLILNGTLSADAEPLIFPYTIANIQPDDIMDADADGDGDALTGSITVMGGSFEGALTITAIDDMVDEGAGERLTIRLSLGALPMNADGDTLTLAPGVAGAESITITDNDDPIEGTPTEITSFIAVPRTITEDGNDTPSATVTLTLNNKLPEGAASLIFPYTIDGIQSGDIMDDDDDGDGNALTGNITVMGDSERGTLTITAIDDTMQEADETLSISLGDLPMNADGDTLIYAPGGDGVDGLERITITDNDTPQPTEVTGFVSDRSPITEANGPLQSATVTLTLDRIVPLNALSLTFPYTIRGTITIADLSSPTMLSGAITVMPGSETGALTITARDDSEDEGDSEALTITLGALPTNANGAQLIGSDRDETIVITDNDGGAGNIDPADQQVIDSFTLDLPTVSEGDPRHSALQHFDLATSLEDIAGMSIQYESSNEEIIFVRENTRALLRCIRSDMESAEMTLSAIFIRTTAGVPAVVGRKDFEVVVQCPLCNLQRGGGTHVTVPWNIEAITERGDIPVQTRLSDRLIFSCRAGDYSNVWILGDENQYDMCDSSLGAISQSVGECVGFVDSDDIELQIRENENTPMSAIRLASNQEYYFVSYSDGEGDQSSMRESGGECLMGLKTRMHICLNED